MSTLAQAPLIEVIFELRWGFTSLAPNGALQLEFTAEDREFFIGQFHGSAKAQGFSHVERVNQPGIHLPGATSVPLLPHLVAYRFRTAPNVWPCYQIGLGVFTTNQINEGYDWSPFKESVLTGLKLLDAGHPDGLDGIPLIGVELRYQDGFLFEPNESVSEFLSNKLNIGFSVPSDLLRHQHVEGTPQGNVLQFSLRIKQPKGALVTELQQALINGKPGLVMNTIVRSADNDKPALDLRTLESWVDNAHTIQRAAFDALINPTYAKSFK